MSALDTLITNSAQQRAAAEASRRDRQHAEEALDHLRRRARGAWQTKHLSVDLTYLDEAAKEFSLARLDRNAIRHAARLLMDGR